MADENRPFTLTTFETVEVLKGELQGRFQVRLPGGIADGRAWAIPGTPTFDLQSEVVLFLDPLNPSLGEYRLTELGLSKIRRRSGRRGKVVRDPTGIPSGRRRLPLGARAGARGFGSRRFDANP